MRQDGVGDPRSLLAEVDSGKSGNHCIPVAAPDRVIETLHKTGREQAFIRGHSRIVALSDSLLAASAHRGALPFSPA
jgi:hypothetical protein